MVKKNFDTDAVFFGIDRGTLNILMNPVSNINHLVDSLQSESLKLHLVETMTIKVKSQDKVIGEAVNEVLIGESIMGYNKFVINSEDESFEDFVVKGVAVCVTTALGSTGYSLNNGGVTLPLNLKLWQTSGVVTDKRLFEVITSQRLQIQSNATQIYIDGILHKISRVDEAITLERGRIIKIGFIDKYSFMRKRIELSNKFRL